jgi:cytochrome d ubiquinol oxidase subunit II
MMNFDYEALRLIFWVVQVLNVIGYSLCEGIMIGTAMLMPLIANADSDRQTILDLLKPNFMVLQTWLISSLVLLFAAWPTVYAVFFSSFQFLLLLLLVAWIYRPLGWYFGTNTGSELWNKNRNRLLSIGGLLIAVMLGLLSGNLLKGVPFHLDSDMRIFFLGDFWSLLNPFSLLMAAASVAVFMLYGASFLQMYQHGEILQSCKTWIYKTGGAFLVLYTLAGLWISRLEGYHITSGVLPNATSNPLNKFVRRSEGLWLDNYEHLPELASFPVLVFLGCCATLLFTKRNQAYLAFISSCITLSFGILTVASSMFPFLLPSNLSLNSSLTIWDASGSLNTLSSLMWFCCIALPLMAVLIRWSFRSARNLTQVGKSP